MPGVPVDKVAAGLFVPLQFDAYEDFALQALTDVEVGFGEGTVSPVLYHPLPGAQPKYTFLTSVTVQRDARTQRSRNLFKGE